MWVFPRVHTGAGLHVEVHRGAADGPLIRRIAVTHVHEASETVEQLRDTMLRQGLGAVSGEIEPLVPRGSVIVHAERPKTLKPVAVLGRSPATFLCARLWVVPGAYHLATAFVSDKLATPPDPRVSRTHGEASMDVSVAAYETVEVYFSFLRRQLVRRRPPPTHWLCRIRHRPTL